MLNTNSPFSFVRVVLFKEPVSSTLIPSIPMEFASVIFPLILHADKLNSKKIDTVRAILFLLNIFLSSIHKDSWQYYFQKNERMSFTYVLKFGNSSFSKSADDIYGPSESNIIRISASRSLVYAFHSGR